MRALLEAISKETNRQAKKTKYTEFKSSSTDKAVLTKEFHQHFLEREDSIVVDWFMGQNIVEFRCKSCNFVSFSSQKFMDIPIYLATFKRWNYNIASLLDAEYDEDTVEWTKCGGCKRKTNYTKKPKISILPKILVVSLQRINAFSNRKISDPVQFNKRIDLKGLVDREVERSSTSYELYAISNHSGSLHFGHYYSYCLVNGEWVEFNDSSVSKMYGFRESSSTGYVAFYRKIE